MTERPPIPRDLETQVRQRCGFGCVICGCPIYDYDHIVDYAEVKEHTFDNLVLLCPTCHRKKKKGLLTRNKIREALAASGSRERTATERIEQTHYTLYIGNNVVKMFAGTVFDIEGLGSFSVSNVHQPQIDGVLYDENGIEAITIKENVYSLSSDVWDIEYVGKILTFRNGPRKVFAKLAFDAERQLIALKADFYIRPKIRVRITDDGIFVNAIRLAAANIIRGGTTGIVITSSPVLLPARLRGAHIYESLFSRISGIAALDSTDCCGNLFDGCQVCFVWTTQFLERIAFPQ